MEYNIIIRSAPKKNETVFTKFNVPTSTNCPGMGFLFISVTLLNLT